MNSNEQWLKWAVELQSIAQDALAYCKDIYDIERFERIREISAEIINYKSDIPLEKVKDLFCNETGYQTPKLDCRAAIFKDDKILLVQENDGTWSLPGGWVDAELSVEENTIKEVREEAGLNVVSKKLIAMQDREKHNLPIYAHKICKVFIECTVISGEFKKNAETIDSKYFSLDELPILATQKNTKEQIKMCFEAHRCDTWQAQFD